MKKVFTFKIVSLAVFLFVFMVGITTGCGSKKASEPPKPQTPVLAASPMLIGNVEAIMNKGYKVIDKQKIYVTKSIDYKQAYFIGTLIDRSGNILPCIWFSNTNDMTGMTMSANDYAIEASSMTGARTSDVQVSDYDDGYLRIHQKLLNDWIK